jgi:Fe-S-cluster containining protein
MKQQKTGFPFSFESTACASCQGHCCTGESGHIWVSRPEIKTISKALGIPQRVFIKKFTRSDGRRTSLTEKPWKDGQLACSFFDGHCTIYNSRPEQCRTFPFWPRYKRRNLQELLDECPGVTPKC